MDSEAAPKLEVEGLAKSLKAGASQPLLVDRLGLWACAIAEKRLRSVSRPRLSYFVMRPHQNLEMD